MAQLALQVAITRSDFDDAERVCNNFLPSKNFTHLFHRVFAGSSRILEHMASFLHTVRVSPYIKLIFHMLYPSQSEH